jgi:hypothetical protein
MKRFSKIFLSVLFLFVFNISVLAKTYYVDNTSTGANTGTSWTDAWQGFAAINWSLVGPGDTIYISGGTTEKTYNEQLFIEISGTEGNPITIKVGQDIGHNGNAIITNAGSYGGLFIMAPYITIDGNVNGERRITIQNCTTTGVLVYGANTHNINLTYLNVLHNGDEAEEHGIRIGEVEYIKPLVEISHCLIDDNWQDQLSGSGIQFAPGFGYVSVHDNIISNLNDDGFECSLGGVDFYNNEMFGKSYDGGEGHPDGLQFYNGYYKIYNNKFHDVTSGNAYIYIEVGTASLSFQWENIYIYNNLIYDTEINTASPPMRGMDCGFGVNPPSERSISNFVIANNVFVNMPLHALLAGFGAPDINNVIIANNIVQNCHTSGGESGVAFGIYDFADSIAGNAGSGAQIIFDHNIINRGNNGSPYIMYDEHWATQEELVTDYTINIHGINTDPLLDSNYHPASESSPVVNSGMNLGAYFTTDLAGVSRPQGSGWDIGAYEYVDLTGMKERMNTPSVFSLYQNYPNPFNPSTKIIFFVTTKSNIKLVIYDLLGRQIRTLVDRIVAAGPQSVSWDGRDTQGKTVSSGVYFYSVEHSGQRITKQMVLIK